MTNNEQKLPACPYCGSKTGEHSADYPHPSAAPTVAAGLPSRKPVQSNLDSESNSQNRGWNRCHDAFTAWLSKAAQGLPEPVAWQNPDNESSICTAEHKRYAETKGGAPAAALEVHTIPLVRLDACTQVVAGMAARMAELETALKYAVAQVPELGTVPGIAAALADEAPES